MSEIKRNSTSVSLPVSLQDSTTGTPKTGITASSVSAYYICEGDTSPTQITVSGGALGTWSSGGWNEISSGNMPGQYVLGLPNAIFSTSTTWVTITLQVTGAQVRHYKYDIIAVDKQNATSFGITDIASISTLATASSLATAQSTLNTINTQTTGLATATALSTTQSAISTAITSATSPLATASSLATAQTSLNSLSSGVTVSGYASNQDPATILKNDLEFGVLIGYVYDKFVYDPATKIVTFYRPNGDYHFEHDLTVDSNGNVTQRIYND